MKDLMRTNNPALISYVESLLKSMNIRYFVADQGISGAEGSIGAFPRRIQIAPEHFEKAKALMIDAGLGNELRP